MGLSKLNGRYIVRETFCALRGPETWTWVACQNGLNVPTINLASVHGADMGDSYRAHVFRPSFSVHTME